MANKLKCQLYRRFFIPHIQGTLSLNAPWLWIRLNAHLAQCDSCSEELKSLMGTHLELVNHNSASHPHLSTTQKSVRSAVMMEIELYDLAKASPAKTYKRFAFGVACAFALLIFAVYIAFGHQIMAVFSNMNSATISKSTASLVPSGSANDPDYSPSPTPTPGHTITSNQPIVGSVLR